MKACSSPYVTECRWYRIMWLIQSWYIALFGVWSFLNLDNLDHSSAPSPPIPPHFDHHRTQILFDSENWWWDFVWHLPLSRQVATAPWLWNDGQTLLTFTINGLFQFNISTEVYLLFQQGYTLVGISATIDQMNRPWASDYSYIDNNSYVCLLKLKRNIVHLVLFLYLGK